LLQIPHPFWQLGFLFLEQFKYEFTQWTNLFTMRTDIVSFVASSHNRRKIVQTLFEHTKRLWSCSALEEVTKLPHATVFRTLQGLKEFGLVKSLKINRKDFVFELVESPTSDELKRILNLEQFIAHKIAEEFVRKVKLLTKSIILYGSSAKGTATYRSDIDILTIVKQHDKKAEKQIMDKAAEISSRYNRTISPLVMDISEIKKEKSFIASVKESMEVLHGKNPF